MQGRHQEYVDAQVEAGDQFPVSYGLIPRAVAAELASPEADRFHVALQLLVGLERLLKHLDGIELQGYSQQLSKIVERAAASGVPIPALGAIQDEARFWASYANDLERRGRAYFHALCDVLADDPPPEAATKKLFLSLWAVAPDEWRRKFVGHVSRADA